MPFIILNNFFINYIQVVLQRIKQRSVKGYPKSIERIKSSRNSYLTMGHYLVSVDKRLTLYHCIIMHFDIFK